MQTWASYDDYRNHPDEGAEVPAPHPFVPDVTSEGVAFVFTLQGGYIPCAVQGCERDRNNDIHR